MVLTVKIVLEILHLHSHLHYRRVEALDLSSHLFHRRTVFLEDIFEFGVASTVLFITSLVPLIVWEGTTHQGGGVPSRRMRAADLLTSSNALEILSMTSSNSFLSLKALMTIRTMLGISIAKSMNQMMLKI
jgi:hypothetical protein